MHLPIMLLLERFPNASGTGTWIDGSERLFCSASVLHSHRQAVQLLWQRRPKPLTLPRHFVELSSCIHPASAGVRFPHRRNGHRSMQGRSDIDCRQSVN